MKAHALMELPENQQCKGAGFGMLPSKLLKANGKQVILYNSNTENTKYGYKAKVSLELRHLENLDKGMGLKSTFEAYEDLNCPSSSGNSGGPLFNENDELIAVFSHSDSIFALESLKEFMPKTLLTLKLLDKITSGIDNPVIYQGIGGICAVATAGLIPNPLLSWGSLCVTLPVAYYAKYIPLMRDFTRYNVAVTDHTSYYSYIPAHGKWIDNKIIAHYTD